MIATRRLLIAMSACLTSVTGMAQSVPWAGRWVSTSSTALAGVLHVGPGGEVQLFLSFPWFPATFSVDGSSVVLRSVMRDGSAQFDTVTMHGDTLSGARTMPFFRDANIVGDTSTFGGTWLSPGAQGPSFLTLRSDGQALLQTPMASSTLHGDTLQLSFAGRTGVWVVHEARGRLYLRDAAGHELTYVRRAWGCYGVERLDMKARECRS